MSGSRGSTVQAGTLARDMCCRYETSRVPFAVKGKRKHSWMPMLGTQAVIKQFQEPGVDSGMAQHRGAPWPQTCRGAWSSLPAGGVGFPGMCAACRQHGWPYSHALPFAFCHQHQRYYYSTGQPMQAAGAAWPPPPPPNTPFHHTLSYQGTPILHNTPHPGSTGGKYSLSLSLHI